MIWLSILILSVISILAIMGKIIYNMLKYGTSHITKEKILEGGIRLIKETHRHRNEKIDTIYYTHKNKLHRENGPAIIMCSMNGEVMKESYYYNNQLHRESGPAIIDYDRCGNIERETYYIRGEQILDELQILVIEGSKI